MEKVSLSTSQLHHEQTPHLTSMMCWKATVNKKIGEVITNSKGKYKIIEQWQATIFANNFWAPIFYNST